MDSLPVFEWAAGAGLDWVLDRDEDMLPHLFGDGSRAAIDAVTDIRTDLNLRELPVAVHLDHRRLSIFDLEAREPLLR